MRLLLDTHVLLWWFDDDPRLGRAVDLIIDPTNDVIVSIVSLWEIAVKLRIGKLRGDLPAIARAIDAQGYDRLDITVAHLEALAALPDHHRDPFDHLLIAQAQVEDLTFVTSDRFAAFYDVAVIACG